MNPGRDRKGASSKLANASGSNSVFIRHAIPQDLLNLLALENECFTEDKLSQRNFRDLLTKKSVAILIAEINQNLIGCAVVFFRKNSQKARLYSLAVSPSFRHHGIAKKLSDEIEKIARDRHCTSLILEVRPDNLSAIAFYEKQNYEIFGTYIKFYEDGADALRMHKDLS